MFSSNFISAPKIPALAYRPDIDGLRAIAVILVLLYHAKFNFLSGGFIGVDIFFVISGYLVCGKLLSRGKISRTDIVEFYFRRIRRIFPALFVTILGVSIFSQLFLLPGQQAAVAKQALFSTIFGANFFFWATTGYFQEVADCIPLLHLWSLGIEEQFYIITPLLLWGLAKITDKKKTIILLAALTGTSFLASVTLVLCDEATPAFYFPHYRMWEFMAGAFIGAKPWPTLTYKIRTPLSFIGLLLCVAPAFLYTRTTPFPGIAAVPPVLGSCLYIYCGLHKPALMNRLLSIKPIVFIGLISYSLYLWHWPIIVLPQMILWLPDITLQTQLMFILLSLTAAAVSWRFVELPFRNIALYKTNPRALNLKIPLLGVAAMTAVLAFSAISLEKTAPFTAYVENLEQDSMAGYQYKECFWGASDFVTEALLAQCSQPDSGQNYLLIGDSHAAHLYPGLKKMVPEISFHQLSVGACRAILDYGRPGSTCGEMNRVLFRELVPSGKYDGVILATRWERRHLARVDKTLAYLKKYISNIILVGPTIEYKLGLPDILYSQNYEDLAFKSVEIKEGLDNELRNLAIKHSVQYFSIIDLLCKNGQCQNVTEDGTPLSWDYGHLTVAGSEYIAKHIKQTCFDENILTEKSE